MTLAQLAAKAAEFADTPAVPARLIREYAPMGDRHELTQGEKGHITRGEHQWLPQLIQTDTTQIPDMMSSPGKGALLAGGLGAAAGGLAGAGIGQAVGSPGKGALIGAAAAGIPAALRTYLSRHHHNDHLQETMQRLPEGATKRDFDAVELLGDAFDRRFAFDKTAAPWTRAARTFAHNRKPKSKRRNKRGEDLPALVLPKIAGDKAHRAVTVRTHQRKLPATRTKKAEDEKRGPAGEYCPHCDARQERGDSGYCNRCGRNSKGEKRAAQRTCGCGADMKGAWCPACKKFDWAKKAADLPPFAQGFLEGCAANGLSAGQIKQAAERLAPRLDSITAGELLKLAGIAGALIEGAEKLAPNALKWLGRGAAKEIPQAAEEAAAKAEPTLMSSLAKPFAGSLRHRAGTGLTAGISAAIDPSADGHHLQAATAAAGAGFLAPQQVMKPLIGYGAGEAADYSTMGVSSLLGHQVDPHLRYILAGVTTPAKEMIGGAFDRGVVAHLPEAVQSAVSGAGRGIDHFAEGMAAPNFSHNPLKLDNFKGVVAPHGFVGPTAPASLPYRAGRVAMNAAGLPINAVNSGAKSLGNAIVKNPGATIATGTSLAAGGIGLAALDQGHQMQQQVPGIIQQVGDQARQQGTEGARHGAYQALGVDPEHEQALQGLDHIQDQLNDPAQAAAAQQQAQSMGLGVGGDGKFDPAVFARQKGQVQENTVLSAHGVDPETVNKLKPFLAGGSGMDMVKSMIGPDISKWFGGIKELFSAGGQAAAGAMGSVAGIADKLLGTFGMNTSGMGTSQKVMTLLGGLGLLGGALTGSPLTALAGGASLAGGLAEQGGPLNGLVHRLFETGGPAAEPGVVPAAGAAPATTQAAPAMRGQDMLDDRGQPQQQ